VYSFYSTAPSLPGKKYVGRFKDPFLMKRQMGLQNFMNKYIIKHNNILYNQETKYHLVRITENYKCL